MPAKRSITSILVIKMRNIGDVLLTTPVFANLREHFPDARICGLVNSGTEAMLSDNPAINQLFTYERSLKKAPLTQRIAHELLFLKKLRSEHFDMVINLTEGDRGAIVALLSGASRRIGVKSNGRGFRGKDYIFTRLAPLLPPSVHTVDQNLELLRAAGVPVSHKRVSFYYPDSVRSEVDRLLTTAGIQPGGYFHAHVVSRWMFKSMPPDTAAALIDILHEKSGLTPILTAAPVEKELAYLERVKQACRSPHLDLSGKLNLKQMGALTATASFFVGVDSAPMHIAAALDIPVLGIFGPSSATSWGPWDNDLQTNPYLHPRGIQSTGKHVVLQSTKPCVPCHRDGCNGSKISDCLNFPRETLDQVVSAFLNGPAVANRLKARD